MNDPTQHHPSGELFRHAEFLQRLARGLLRDEQAAEDVAQDAFVLALERPPRSTGSLSAWLARVTRNLALNRHKSEQRRAAREELAARVEHDDTDEKAAERLDLQRFVAERVFRLDEAKRTALYLRYYEGLEPLAISKQLGVPVKTVKTRLARALAELRGELDARAKGDRNAWVSALVPLAAVPEGLVSVSGGVVGSLLMKKVVVALAVLLAGGFLWTSVRSNEVEPEAPLVASEELLAEPPPLPEADAPAPPAREELARIEAQEPRDEQAVAAPADLNLIWYGRVVDGESGAPLAGARVERVRGGPFTEYTGQPTAWSGADGHVKLDFVGLIAGCVRVELDGYATGYAGLTDGHERLSTALPIRLLRAPMLELVVTAVDEAPLEGLVVRATFTAAELVQGGINGRWLQSEDPLVVGRTDPRGRCVLEGLPAEVAHWKVGGPCQLAGQTLEADGRPAAGVAVWLVPSDGMGTIESYQRESALRTRSDADGRFTLEAPAGSWSIGPAPVEGHEESEAIASVGTPVVIAPGQEHAEVTLTCWRGLYVKGQVLSPDGDVLRSAHVTALGAETFADSNTRDGTFTLGPLPAGTFSVRATANDVRGLAPSESVSVEAGAEHLELVLQRGAGLTVRVLAPDGNGAIDAMVWVLAEPGSEGGLGQQTTAKGLAEFPALGPGTYSLSASSAAGEFALLRGLRLDEGSTRDVALRLAPAARLRLEILPRPEPRMSVEILQDGCPIAHAVWSESPVVPLAPGEYELALKHRRDGRPVVLQTQRVRVLEGGETRAVFDLSEGR
ncbi:MAG: sigma-70 family RNA polymerase sigma factor [Planctomycetota bacterium]